MAGGVDGISQDWWDRWWEDDWSWEGLAKKPWDGWVVPEPGAEPVLDEEYNGFNHPDLKSRFGPEARTATLQDYWRDQEQCLEKGPGGVSFTRLHLPFEWQDGTPTGKADWPSNALNALIESRLNQVADRAFEAETSLQILWRAQFQGGVFLRFRPSELDLYPRSRSERPQLAIRCDTCAFAGPAGFTEAAFAGHAWFSEAAFAGHAWFSEATFAGPAWFDKAAFAGPASFDKAAFAGPAGFTEAAFAGPASFDKAAFAGPAWFNKAAFAGPASFNKAAFAGPASFDKAAFAGHAWFSEAAFAGPAWFTEAAFAGHAWFTGKGTSVTTDPIKGNLQLDPAAAPKAEESQTGQLHFPEQTSWLAKRSFPNASFKQAVFLDRARFDNRDFLSDTSFKNAIFLREAEVHDSKLHRGISFRDTQMKSGLERGKAVPEIEPQFQHSWDAALERLHGAEKRAAEIRGKPVLDFETWKKDFTQKRRTAEDDFSTSPQHEQSTYFGRLEDCYRTLKQLMEDKRDRGQEAHFFKLELKARRNRRDRHVPWWERQASDVYGAISDFGTSIFRPLVWLTGSVFAFAIAYWIMGTWFAFSPSWQGWGDALSFSFGRVLPFGPWSEPDACGLMGRLLDLSPQPGAAPCPLQDGADYTMRGGTPIWVRLLASVQSLTAIILVFLSGLAVRRKFQIN
ncbi:pentapeptide repeat-containing protein [Henriciella sp. AS95]|uniref:pentapeptide repeat-containing protein n=1 Tax=Henriciella sp. AS95 TaxID=3135782 RepID=UPI00316C1F1E